MLKPKSQVNINKKCTCNAVVITSKVNISRQKMCRKLERLVGICKIIKIIMSFWSPSSKLDGLTYKLEIRSFLQTNKVIITQAIIEIKLFKIHSHKTPTKS